MQIQLLREWAGPKDPFGSFTVYPQHHVGQVESDVGCYLVAVGYARLTGSASDEQIQGIALFGDIVAALRCNNVEPTIKAVGETLSNMIALEQQTAAPAQISVVEIVVEPLVYDPPRPEPVPEPAPARKKQKAA